MILSLFWFDYTSDRPYQKISYMEPLADFLLSVPEPIKVAESLEVVSTSNTIVSGQMFQDKVQRLTSSQLCEVD